MKIDVLKEFLCLSKKLSYTVAARELFVSQPVLSRHIVDLEEELECSLFLRNKRSVELTRAGKILANRAGELVALHDDIALEVKTENSHLGHRIRVGYLTGASAAIVLAGKSCSSMNFLMLR